VDLLWSPASDFQVWQYEQFGEQWSAPAVAGPDRDPDGDGWTNNDEWITGTLPNSAASRFVASFGPAGVTFTKVAGRTYNVETSADPRGGWTPYATVPSGAGSVTVPVSPAAAPRRFFRVSVGWSP
jgi:hypothetical protein